jgi:GH25 family lysozyme M1 (1,4-beta-N-acetylmuramidase)
MKLKSPLCIDVSHWRPIADFNALLPRPYLVITKATEHVSFTDTTFISHFEKIKQAGMRRGCYHFYRRYYDSFKQAQHFCNTIRPYVVDTDILILDVEEGGEQAAKLMEWFQYVENQYPRNLLMIYSRRNLLDAITMTAAQKEYFKSIPVWVAGYPLDPDKYTSVPMFYIPDPTRWGDCWLWQYTEKGQVTGATIEGLDCNWIAPSLLAILGATEPPQEEPMLYTLTVITAYLNGRTAPNGTINFPSGATLTTGFRLGDVVTSTLRESNWYRIDSCRRNGQVVPLPSPCWAYAGVSGGYMRLDIVSEIPAPVDTLAVTVDVVLNVEGYAPKTLQVHGELERVS